jgi:hypothetical protein
LRNKKKTILVKNHVKSLPKQKNHNMERKKENFLGSLQPRKIITKKKPLSIV